ncbi:uncharacterized protein K489DRAFT_85098 [Dissoconium aciculare CBS 342.82]|uniref:Secreted protein n=1 Tax=Dissoconium aciculare CBS 342.82 TaxID=1314786 RepID=A0A6J3LUM3_9PEZI|nr:uncharacterized protein K489DRAFT_85098 [Dissoconium aciculare CBS 342.82]KAF1818969.1 hypothetical protein K489DRAFT_85098 [Dissoconium aciculare CBS 342.82]
MVITLIITCIRAVVLLTIRHQSSLSWSRSQAPFSLLFITTYRPTQAIHRHRGPPSFALILSDSLDYFHEVSGSISTSEDVSLLRCCRNNHPAGLLWSCARAVNHGIRSLAHVQLRSSA